MTFSADEYRTAAAVLRAHIVTGLNGEADDLAEEADSLADAMEDRDEYAFVLGNLARTDTSTTFSGVGYALLDKLDEDGWVVPDGLF